MPVLVIQRGQILFGRGDAHLDAHVALEIQIPGTGMADHIAVARLDELRVQPMRIGQFRHAKTGIETFGQFGRGSYRVASAERC